ncbi:sigma-70 family RNA polymerase sigma factor [Staphylococcus sp. 17KM0847]|uniref:sigma-70 family RNA polymerase sigma factor n=1 Tax=Staphylococcus sp. 17KM0847 TaxID=2583989 RepID=UPI0015DC8CC6|nr:sigma-70 family RNA polymerase sigma factor [Staphylococcus sp. 17KM0847]QLK86308.1 sigma-70 family RNA polymerase sigma factor [Staphylococcus sp. 17KM0847]
MDFNKVYANYYKLIHFLLHRNRICYNYDEYFQLLLIKMWLLSQQYDTSYSIPLHQFLIYRLKFYLIDLIRKNTCLPEHYTIDLIDTSHLFIYNDDLLLSIQEWILLLPFTHRQWFDLYLQGYTQKEIAAKINRSTTSIKKYKKETLAALYQSHFAED